MIQSTQFFTFQHQFYLYSHWPRAHQATYYTHIPHTKADWMDWTLFEYKQLNQYHAQSMFGAPTRQPPVCNIIPLIWKYMITSDEIKKYQCIYNGSSSRCGSVILAHIYAADLYQSGVRMFWTISDLHNYNVYGTNAANDFSEAPHQRHFSM